MAFRDWLDGWKEGGWRRGGRGAFVFTLAGLLVLYGVFVTVALPSNGTTDHVYLEAGTNEDGSMFYRCVVAKSTPGVCDESGDGNPDHARMHVHARDRVEFTVHSLDGGDRAHDFKMEGWSYFLPPARLEMELHHVEESKTITAWHTGTYHIKCELPGHEARGMWGTLIVE